MKGRKWMMLFALILPLSNSQAYANVKGEADIQSPTEPPSASSVENDSLPEEWVHLATSPAFNVFVDMKSIIKGEFVSDILLLLSFPASQTDDQGRSFRSATILYRVRCKEKTAQILHSTRFAGEKGHGTPVGKSGEEAPYPGIQDSFADGLLKLLCPAQDGDPTEPIRQ
jgi:hypothetical protein